MRVLPDYELLDQPRRKPIVLSGRPRELRGEICLCNPGDKRVVVRGARIVDLPSEAVPARQAADGPAVRLTRILRSGQSSTAPIVAGVNPHTPPGVYTARFVLGEHAYPLELHVAESVELEISPNPLIIECPPGGRERKQVTIWNQGNTPLALPQNWVLPIDDPIIECRTLRSLAAEAEDGAETLEQLLAAYLRSGKRHLDAAGLLWVENLDGETVIPAGRKHTCWFEVRRPKTHDPISRYVALLPISTVDLEIILVPFGSSVETDRPPVKKKPARRKPGKATAKGLRKRVAETMEAAGRAGATAAEAAQKPVKKTARKAAKKAAKKPAEASKMTAKKAAKKTAQKAAGKKAAAKKTAKKATKKATKEPAKKATKKATKKAAVPKDDGLCFAITKSGTGCSNPPRAGSKYCASHKGYRHSSAASKVKKADTKPRHAGAKDTKPSVRKS